MRGAPVDTASNGHLSANYVQSMSDLLGDAGLLTVLNAAGHRAHGGASFTEPVGEPFVLP